MYSARIETDSGQIFNFGYDYGTVFDIDPLTGVDVDISTSQGFQQVGETVESQSVGGITRSIKGTIIKDARQTAAKMLKILLPFTAGRLYFKNGNEEYFCYITIKKTPVILTDETSKITRFSLQVYCHNPFWLGTTEKAYIIGGYTPAFQFPVIYDTHTFGELQSDAFVDCYNNGVAQTEFNIKFAALYTVTNYGVIDVVTLEELYFNDTLELGEIVNVYRKNGRLYAEKTVGGVTTDIFSKLADDSNLLYLKTGSNVLKATATDGLSGLQVSVSFYEGQAGVLNATA